MIRINDFTRKATLKTAVVMSGFLLIAAAAAFGQINLTVAPTTTTLPDGTTVPMWGYSCGAAVTGSTATCAALNPAAGAAWSPVVITVPTGTPGAPASLTINLTNNLSFTPTGSTTANTVPTSIVIVGQVGGGLGGAPTRTQSPSHTDAQGCPTWFIATQPPGTPCTALTPGASNMPPTQANRVQSMGTEVAAGATTFTPLTWAALKPGTYLLESGTHPSIQVPMGLIGMLVVTTAPSGTTAGAAYPAVNGAPAVPYNAEVPVEFSEIDPVQNNAVNLAVNTAGFSETKVWSGMTGQCGNPSSPTYGQCYPPAVNYTPLYYLINGVAFNKTNAGASVFQATAGTAIPTGGTTPVPVTTGITGTVLVRLVNAGVRMHTPSIVNSQTNGFNGAGAAATVAGFTLIAEDGNVLPNVAPPGATVVPAAPRVQTDVLMLPSKVYDALVNVPAASTCTATPCPTPAIPIFARDLALSANSSVRDAGMLAYISVNNGATPSAGLPAAAGTGVFAAAQANPDTYNSVVACPTTATSCTPLVVSDLSKGVIANDVNVYGVALVTPPTSGTLTCTSLGNGLCANGTFTYTPKPGFSSGTPDSFGYCANGAVAGTANLCTTVTLSASTLTGPPVTNNITYTSKMATFLKIPSPGVLSVDSDPNNLPLQVVVSSVAPTGMTINMDPNGGFTASLASPPTTATTATFTYVATNSQGRQSSPATVTINFPTPSNLQVKVLDAQLYRNCNLNSTCISGLTPLTDYRWIIEEDKTFWVDPNCTTNSSITTAGCPSVVGGAGTTGSTVPAYGVNFHTSNADFVAQGCTGPLSCEGGQMMLDNNPASTTFGQHVNAVCDLGNGACRPDLTGNGFTAVLPSSVNLDPAKRYYISVLPGDAANPFPAYLGAPACSPTGGNSTTGQCGHTMGGASVPPACNILGGPNVCTGSNAFQPVNVLVLPTPLPTGKLSVIVFEDDFPLNGEQDGGGGNGTVAPIEPGLGGFNLVLWDTYGGLGDFTGQDTYDEFNQPLSNSLAGTKDPVTGMDACPVSPQITANVLGTGNTTTSAQGAQKGITGMIVTCPKYESDGQTLSPLAGQAVIANLMPDKFSVQAYPGADRIARGEEWIQTNTLDGQHPHDSFIRIGEPSYFQEYGPAGYHVMIGFANPAIINGRHTDVCNGFGTPGTVGPCTNTITGQVDVQRASRTPDQRLYPSGSRAALAWTQCWVSLGDPDGEDFEFTKCDANGNFQFTSVPGGNWRITIGDQWNDQIIDGISTPANVGCTSTAPNGTINATTCPGGQTLAMGNIGVQQWQSNVYTRTFIDDNKDGIWEPNEIGIPFNYTMIRYRDGHNANSLVTDFNGIANFNETFPLFNWYTVEADLTRYKTTGIHTVYDAGGPADGSPSCGSTSRPCGSSTAYNNLTNTFESVPLPADLSVPGAVYCAKADCTAEASSFAAGTAIPSPGTGSTASTGRIDPPWVDVEGFSGLTSHANWIDFGKAPYAACPPACATVTATAPGATTPTTTQVGENGGIHGQVAYASTRPFDDASQMIQQPWEPLVPHVTVNLYQEGFAADGVTPTLTLVDTTQTSSWDDWAQGFYPNSTATPGTGQTSAQKPYMNCPGQGTSTGTNADVFFFTLFDQPNFLDWYNSEHNGGTLHTLPYNSQYKCYDSMHIGNQLQPAPYDGKYSFPSSLGIDPATGTLVSTVGSTNGVNASMPGTNCTVCVANPDSTDKYRVGTPMLPPGKYVVQVIMPPGYEVYKEEDKNLLIGDNFIAPVAQQFGGLGTDIFIIPDQASVASLYDETGSGYNPSNFQNSTTGLGLADELSGVPGFPGFVDPLWPCVGEMRVVPDYLSLYPQVHETGPFAGATRPLCDRKEVTLSNQMAVSAKFYIFTSTHIASKFTGGITDDLTSEFDPFSPQFGEKFAPPNMPVSTRDYLGNEISRVYSDHWGTYDGLTFSSWEVNPPNITGYSPSIMVQCMNDPGPVLDTNASSPTYGQMITDPLYNPAYSDFCYEIPFMPGLTTYNDTPVVPTEAFIGAGYNNPDCAYPDATPAIKEVDGDGIGPWVSVAGNPLTITALGDVQVNNSAYSGPSASVAPFNSKTVGRHYGFGSGAGCTPVAPATTCTGTEPSGASVTIGGIPAPVTSWSDSSITVTVPQGVPNCAIQQQAQYVPAGTTSTQCGQLVITAGSGKQSIDTVTVTIGGKQPKHVNATDTVQGAIDAANPGDLIMVDPTCMTVATTTTPSATAACDAGALHMATPTQTASVGSHTEMLIMWKPVRLQGVGAVSSVISANANPAGQLLDPWRRHINCLFGLTLQGVPAGGSTPYDPTGQYSCPDAGWNNYVGPGSESISSANNLPQVDRIPLEAVLGWDATLNGNLAEQLQEPSLMGAYEGAGITVLSKGVYVPPGATYWSGAVESAFPAGSLLLQNVPVSLDSTGATLGPQYSYCTTPGTTTELMPNPYPSNFECNPSSIDGLSITNSSQGGGGVFVHGWAHNLQIANNRVYNNAGTLSGGITVGQGEYPDAITVTGVVNGVGEQSALDTLASCQDSTVVGTKLPYCLDVNVNVHNNNISQNSSLGDELFSGTLAGGGGASFCTGADYYKFQYNWVCGNLSAGEGGGFEHMGFIYNGDIEHNTIVLNQSSNPTIPTNGGGIMALGTPDTDPVCGTTIPDVDCPPGLSDGTGPGLVINANLIQANSADSGAGGGIRLQQVNGTDVSTFPSQPTLWNSVSVTNNIIANNIAGWDGAGISLQDSLNVSIINNTIASNDSLASSGVLTQSIGTPQASAPAGNCVQNGPTGPTTASCPQSAGVTSTQNSALLTTTFAVPITCPTGQANCTGFSNPLLQNNVIWQNRSFYIGITGLGAGTVNQQNLVALFTGFNGAATPAPVTPAGYTCPSGVSYWDVGVRGDIAPGSHDSGFTLNPTNSVLDDPTDYPSGNNIGSNPSLVSQYCNGSRVPPSCTAADGCGGPNGYGVPPGIVDAQTPNPVFTLTPSATVDEGNNWINVSWGPLALSDDSMTGGANGNYGGGSPFANYVLAAGSPAIDVIPTTAAGTFPSTDFFGNPRPDPANPNAIDIGAVEFQIPAPTLTAIIPNTGYLGYSVAVTLTGKLLTGATFNLPSGITVSGTPVVTATSITATFAIASTATLGANSISVTAGGFTSNSLPFTVTNPPVPTLTSVTPATGLTGSSQMVTLTGTYLQTATAVTQPSVVVSGTGVTVSNVVVVNDTTLTATFAVAVGSAAGPRTVSVTTLGGTSTGGPTFTVTVPTITLIAPSTGYRGYSYNPVTFTGSGLTGATAVNGLAGSGITVSNLVVVNDTTVTATFAIAANASLTTDNISLSTPAGTTNTVAFTVTNPPTPTITVITPNTGVQGTTVPVTITGTSLLTTSAVTVAPGGGVTVNSVTPVNDTTVTANFVISSGAFLSARTVTLTTLGGTSNSLTFTVIPPTPPTLTSIAPNTGVRGTSVPVIITGANLTGGTIGISGTGVTVSGTPVVTATSITATFVITASAGTNHNVTVTTAGGTSNAVTFTVQAATLTSIAPNTGSQGSVVPVTLTGTNLTGATGINVPPGSGITVGAFTAVSSTSVTATFTIAAGAPLGGNPISVATPIGNTNNETFTVGAVPTLTSIAPTSGDQGTNVAVTLNGANLTGATAINVPAGITVSGLTVNGSGSRVNATFAIAPGATLGANPVSVTTPNGTSNSVNFTVLPEAPSLTSISPISGFRGATVPVTLTGVNLTGATSVNVSGNGITVSGVTVVNNTTVTANFAISGTANSTTPRNVSVTTPSGTSNTVPFTVLVPTLTLISPSSGYRGASVTVTITANGGLTGATGVNAFGGTVPVTMVTDTSVTATLNLAGVGVGNHNVNVALAGGNNSNNLTFTVVAPTLATITPNTGLRGTSVPVTLTGAGLTGSTGLNISNNGNGGITVSNFTVVTDSTVTATLNLAANAGTGNHNISVATPGGNTNSVSFTVQGPTLASIAPTSGTHGTTVPVTLTGTNLTGATGVTMGGGGGVTCTGVTGTPDGTTVTASCAISNGATGTRNVTVATPIGNASLPGGSFTIN